MEERGFVDALIKTIKAGFPGSAYIRSVDSFTLGIPDLLIWIPAPARHPWSVAIEAKQLRPLMDDPFHRGRRTGLMLKHEFTGPQISYLRLLKNAGVDAFGLVRASEDTAFRIEPRDIPNLGNFTHEQMISIGKPVHRVDGLWEFWKAGEAQHDQVSSSGHRGDSGD